jgi:hypothetical protein
MKQNLKHYYKQKTQENKPLLPEKKGTLRQRIITNTSGQPALPA